MWRFKLWPNVQPGSYPEKLWLDIPYLNIPYTHQYLLVLILATQIKALKWYTLFIYLFFKKRPIISAGNWLKRPLTPHKTYPNGLGATSTCQPAMCTLVLCDSNSWSYYTPPKCSCPITDRPVLLACLTLMRWQLWCQSETVLFRDGLLGPGEGVWY